MILQQYSIKVEMADENCFEDDERILDGLFCGNLFEELVKDGAESSCETETENYDSTNQPGNQYNDELDDGDIDTFIHENRNKNTVKKTTSDVNQFQKWWTRRELLTKYLQANWIICSRILWLKFESKAARNLNLTHLPHFSGVLIVFYDNKDNSTVY